ncbi:MAG: response regulator [Armatimonadetes bacterium]|nr:response regulator [Armatimonadota bacterium]MDE2205963.1 response regulator [Armatimonadota bacterium]
MSSADVKRSHDAATAPAKPGRAIGTPLSSFELDAATAAAMDELADALGLDRLIALSVVDRERVLLCARAVGIPDSSVMGMRIELADAPGLEAVERSGEIVTWQDAERIPAPLNRWLNGESVVIPLRLGGRSRSLLVGQLRHGISSRSERWLARARTEARFATMLVELVRTAAAYRSEVDLRQNTREIAAHILEGRGLPDVASLVIDAICKQLAVSNAVFLLRRDDGTFEPIRSIGVVDAIAEPLGQFILGPTSGSREVATRLPVRVHEVATDTRVPAALRTQMEAESLQSLLALVMHVGSTVNGVVAVFSETSRVFTPAELTTFQIFVDQATLAVEFAQLLSRQRELATMAERSRLAREMHDTVAQSIIGVLTHLQTLRTDCTQLHSEPPAALLTAIREAQKALAETRRAIQGLQPQELEQMDLTHAIQAATRGFEQRTSMPVLMNVDGREPDLRPEVRSTLLRICQESLANIQQHAHARRVRLRLEFGAAGAHLTIEDDGVGFDPEGNAPGEREPGYGLEGMAERARLTGGTLQVESRPGWGTRVTCVIPYRNTPSVPLRGAQHPQTRNDVTSHETHPAGAVVRVIVVDDHTVTREGIRSLIETSGDIEVIAEAENGLEAVGLAEELEPDLVLMDLQMPVMDGIEATRRIRALNPNLPVVILSTFAGEARIRDALAAGAIGYLLKDSEPEELVSAIRAAVQREVVLSPELASRIASQSEPEILLNPRETEILSELAKGARNKEIAGHLFIAPSTVEYHLSNLFAKLGVTNRTEAVRVGMQRRLLAPPEADG